MDHLDAAFRLVTRREAEPLLGYAPGSLKAVMQQQRGRWPGPVACRRRDRALLWELDVLLAAARPAARVRSRRPDGADPDGLVTCLACGRRFRSLAPHLARVHGMSAARYRAEHALPASAALMATDVRRSLSATRTEAMAADPDLLEPMRACAPPAEELARRSARAREATDGLPAVRAARRSAALRTVPAAQQARRDALEATARAAGFASMTEAIEATRDMPSRAAAARIGVGASTVKRRRRQSRS
ncbi:ROS/MUCR transcriptional regulator protein [Streptomyces sp. TLI_053]|uniref:MucR family transcriptional regulator n=1 Tax=Streptomyces sp. TLI_053 TaxID=1855352 RepID=UPI00087DC3A6|nr:MucR family transcriptional regulator [Streptomyces sp. TLI_053]SDT83444.1 ROS/MUCR transcriptional regulator protein [Streptomyces sp. TLI_053]